MKRKSLFITLPLALFLCTEANAQLGVLIKDAATASPTTAQKRLHVDASVAGVGATTTLQGILLTNGGTTGTTVNDGLLVGVGTFSVVTNPNGGTNSTVASTNSYSILNRESSSLVLGTGSEQSAIVIKNNGYVGISAGGTFATLSTTADYVASGVGGASNSTSTSARRPNFSSVSSRLTVRDLTSGVTGLLAISSTAPAGHFINNGTIPTLIAQNMGNNGPAARFINAGGSTGNSITVYVQNRAHLANGGLHTGVYYEGVGSTPNQIAFRAEMSGNGNRGFFAYQGGDHTSVPVSGQKVVGASGTGYGNRNNPFQGQTFFGGATTGIAHTGVVGHVFANNVSNAYAFGVYGDASPDGVSASILTASGSRIGGVLGRVYDGEIGASAPGAGDGTRTFTYGILGYRDGGSTSFGAYLINNIAGDGTGTERLSGTSSEGYNKVGIGAFAGVTGAIVKGGYYGMSVKGNRFAVYADGKTITNDVIAQVTNTNGTERVATYVPTSTTVDVSSRGVAQLVNGTTFVNFDANYTQLVEEGSVMVTVTPNGASAGVYVAEVTSKGFRVIENGNGTSNVAFTWRADAVKKGMNGMTLPEEVLANDYDTNMRKTMITDMDANQDGRKSMSIVNGKLTFKDASQAPVKAEQPTKGE